MTGDPERTDGPREEARDGKTDLTPGARLGPYEIGDKLGAGGMGQVYRARDTRLGRAVAIKVSSEEFTARFAQEARAISSLNHAYVCTLYDVGPNYLVMELVDGETLEARLRKGPLPAETVTRLAGQMAEALIAAHSKGIIHRDLKPGNIMLTKSGVKVLDFGLAKFLRTSEGADAEAPTTLTMSQELIGTLPYMSPEQLEGKHADVRTDIFALGLIVCEMATGKRVFGGKTQPELIAEIVRCETPRPENVPSALSRVIRGCLAKDPDERWQSGREFRIALEASMEGKEPAQVAQHHSRRTWIWPAATLFLLAALAAVWLLRPGSVLDPVSFQMLPPEGGTFADPIQPDTEIVSISPDGRRVAFCATVDGVTLLWVRVLSEFVSRPLAGTENAYAPFWSPDSKFIAFFADGKLKRIALDGGGAPQTIADVSPTASTGTWGSGGDILFSDRHASQRQISRVRVSEGTVSTLIPHGAERHNFWPHFLPDGKRFLYLELAPDGKGQVMAASLDDDPKPRVVLSERSRAAYAPPGYLLFVREGALIAQRFDLDSLTTEGATVTLAPEMQYFRPTGQAPFSVSATGALSYQSIGAASQLVWVDRNGRELGRVGKVAGLQTPRLSPDDRRIAVAIADRRTGTADIHIFDRSNPESSQRLTSEPGDEFWPLWSPKGDRIVFSWDNGAVPFLHVKPLDNSGPAKPIVAPTGGVQQGLDWLQDGSILYEEVNTETQYDLLVLEPGESRKSRKILSTRFAERYGAVYGRWLVYVSDENDNRNEVYVRPFSGPGRPVKISTNGGTSPRWARNGREIYYVEKDRLMAVPVQLTPDFDHGPAIPLFQRSDGIVDFDVDAEGRFLVNSGRWGFLSGPINVTTNWMALQSKP